MDPDQLNFEASLSVSILFFKRTLAGQGFKREVKVIFFCRRVQYIFLINIDCNRYVHHMSTKPKHNVSPNDIE